MSAEEYIKACEMQGVSPEALAMFTLESELQDKTEVVCVKCGARLSKYGAMWTVVAGKSEVEGPYCGVCHEG